MIGSPCATPVSATVCGGEDMKGKLGACLTDLFFLPRCAACGELCRPFRCLDTDIPSALCDECLPLWQASGSSRPTTSGVGDGGHIWLVPYRPQRADGVPERVIYRIKHQDDRRLIEWVTAELAQPVREVLAQVGVSSSEVVCLYPPRRKAAVRRDGFDQARSLAEGLARQLGAVCLPAIRRCSDGAGAQKELDAAARRLNAEAAYRIDEAYAPHIAGKWVLPVDDLATTGATLGRLATLSRSAGAAGVLFVTVARTTERKIESDRGAE